MLKKKCCLLLCLLLFSSPLSGGEVSEHKGSQVRLAILVAKNLAPYEQALQSFIRKIESYPLAITSRVWRFWQSPFDETVKNKISQVDYIVAVGTKATQLAIDSFPEKPIIFTMVLQPPPSWKKHKLLSGVRLDVPLQRYFQEIKELLPHRTRIGLIYSGNRPQQYIAKVRAQSEKRGYQAITFKVTSPSDINAISLESIEILWLIPDKLVCRPPIIRQLLIKSIKSNTAVVGLSPSYTKAGALFSLTADFREVGAQSAELLYSLILKNPHKRKFAVVPPKKINLAINLTVARRLGMKYDQTLIKRAQKVFGN